MTCEVCALTDKECFAKYGCGLTVDHIVPARMAAKYGDPHALVNLEYLCSCCHGRKRGAEGKLFGHGGMLGFILELRGNNWTMVRVHAAFVFYQIWPKNLDHLIGSDLARASTQ